jgi:Fe-S cluster assembly protein SufD
MSASELNREWFTAAVQAIPADELSSTRDNAASLFVQSGFPTSRDENWKYTNLSGVADITNAWLSENADGEHVANADPAVAHYANLQAHIDAHWLLIQNGVVDKDSLARVQRELGTDVTVTQLSDQHDIAVDDPMSAFNAALLRDGLHVTVNAKAKIEKPLGFLQVDHSSQQASQSRILIDLEASAQLGVVECVLSGDGGAQFSNSVTQANLAAGATLNHVRLQMRDGEHIGVNRFTANLDRDAFLGHNAFDFGGALTRNDVVANILGADADVRLYGLYLASGNQHVDNHTRVEHRVGPAFSEEEYRGVLNGRSRCVFNGQAVVFEGADGTDANQANHNLLLSEHAEIDTKPELEIYADDVKCSHGATVGQLDEASLFYLRTRGLEQDEARQLLTQAFAAEILGKLAVEECREFLTGELANRLADLVDDAQ